MSKVENVREMLQLFVRRFGLLNASCHEFCCGEKVSLVQSHILYEIRQQADPSMQQVAEALGMDITTFSRQIKTLEAKKMVTKRPSPDDRRINLLSLTTEGEKTLAQIDDYMILKVDALFSGMTEFERETVLSSFHLLNKALLSAGPCCGGKVVNCK